MARHFMHTQGFRKETFISLWFLVYFIIRIVAMFGQLYVFSVIELGRTSTLFGVAGLVFANIAGILLFKEVLPLTAYVGVVLAVIAFFVVGLAKSST